MRVISSSHGAGIILLRSSIGVPFAGPIPMLTSQSVGQVTQPRWQVPNPP